MNYKQIQIQFLVEAKNGTIGGESNAESSNAEVAFALRDQRLGFSILAPEDFSSGDENSEEFGTTEELIYFSEWADLVAIFVQARAQVSSIREITISGLSTNEQLSSWMVKIGSRPSKTQERNKTAFEAAISVEANAKLFEFSEEAKIFSLVEIIPGIQLGWIDGRGYYLKDEASGVNPFFTACAIILLLYRLLADVNTQAVCPYQFSASFVRAYELAVASQPEVVEVQKVSQLPKLAPQLLEEAPAKSITTLPGTQPQVDISEFKIDNDTTLGRGLAQFDQMLSALSNN